MLHDLQSQFLARIAAGDPRADALVRGDLGVYAFMYEARLLEAMRATFPEMAERPGFDELARQYLAQHPSRHPSLRQLGASFPAFSGDPLAQLEWARVEVFDAEDVPLLSLPELHGMAPGELAQLHLQLVPAHRFVGGRLVWRCGVQVFDRAVDAVEAPVLRRCAEGLPLGNLCEEVGDARQVFAWLTSWAQDEILRRT